MASSSSAAGGQAPLQGQSAQLAAEMWQKATLPKEPQDSIPEWAKGTIPQFPEGSQDIPQEHPPEQYSHQYSQQYHLPQEGTHPQGEATTWHTPQFP